jgi:hypothetical protein
LRKESFHSFIHSFIHFSQIPQMKLIRRVEVVAAFAVVVTTLVAYYQYRAQAANEAAAHLARQLAAERARVERYRLLVIRLCGGVAVGLFAVYSLGRLRALMRSLYAGQTLRPRF